MSATQKASGVKKFVEAERWAGMLTIVALLVAALGVAALFALNRFKVVHATPYVLVGVFLWAAVLKSGMHATLTGVIVALAIPLREKRNGIEFSPLRDMESSLRPWVVLGIVPVFAFFNAGITISALKLDVLWTPAALGIALGLFFGKQLGVFSAIWLAVRCGMGRLPEGVNWLQVYGVALLAGIGFTMSLFITSLAFDDKAMLTSARLAILVGSILSAVAGLVILSRAAPCRREHTEESRRCG